MSLGWLLSAALVLALDQASKAWALGLPARTTGGSTGWGPRIRVVHNTRLCRGLRRPGALALLWVGAVAGNALLLAALPTLGRAPAGLALGAAVGGATGNLVDVLRRGGIVDFVDLRVWPVFNLADAAIVVGGAIALLSLAAGEV